MENSENPFSGELKGKLLKNLNEDKSDFFEENFIPEFTQDKDGTYIFSLKDASDVIFSKVPLATLTSNLVSINEKNYLSVDETKVHKDYKEKGIATNIYRYIMENLPKNCLGIYSPSETRANDIIIPKIYEKLSQEFDLTKDSKDNYFLTRKIV